MFSIFRRQKPESVILFCMSFCLFAGTNLCGLWMCINCPRLVFPDWLIPLTQDYS